MVIVNLTLVVLYLNGGKLTRSDCRQPYSESNWILLRVEIEEKKKNFYQRLQNHVWTPIYVISKQYKKRVIMKLRSHEMVLLQFCLQ